MQVVVKHNNNVLTLSRFIKLFSTCAISMHQQHVIGRNMKSNTIVGNPALLIQNNGINRSTRFDAGKVAGNQVVYYASRIRSDKVYFPQF